MQNSYHTISRMLVKKRDGTLQQVDLNKIVVRLQRLINGEDDNRNVIGEKLSIDPINIATKVCGQLQNGITTDELDRFSADTCVYMTGENYEYGVLANRLIISSHHKNTIDTEKFSVMMTLLHNDGQLDEKFFNYVQSNAEAIDNMINHQNDYLFLDYIGLKTLQASYFLKVRSPEDVNKIIHIERYQQLLMREAVAIFLGKGFFKTPEEDLGEINHIYSYMSYGYYTHATPTMYNAGTKSQQFSSCFLLNVDDSLHGMYDCCVSRSAEISKNAGGIGLSISDIRAKGTKINGTNGISDGLIPFLKTLNSTAAHIDQGGGRRKGSIAVYAEPWHADIISFLEAKKPVGSEESRARDLFYGLWIPDIFMRRVEQALSNDQQTVMWSLMCPYKCPRLTETYGQEFEDLYEYYEKSGMYNEQIDIMKLWNAIISSQIESGGPYMCYKDHVNNKSAQKNIGIIKSSNLCTEIMEFASNEEYGTCNLASINLKMFVSGGRPVPHSPLGGGHAVPHSPLAEEHAGGGHTKKTYDFNKLRLVAQRVCKNLNNIIDINVYPVKESERSNFRHRPIGIGVQGLAETFIEMGMPFTSPEARDLNKKIFETIYYGALEASCELAQERTAQLQKLSTKDLQDLSALSSTIDYFRHYLKTFDNEARKKLSVAEECEKQRAEFCLKDSLNNIQNIIKKYSISEYYSEYQYLSSDKQYLGAYSTFVGSPSHQGILQFSMLTGSQSTQSAQSSQWDWTTLTNLIQKHGLRNSLLTTVMPTASTAHILGNTECIEPISAVIYVKNLLSGSYLIINNQLQRILTDMGIWSKTIKDKIFVGGGSIQNIEEIPLNIRKLFLTAYELSKKDLIYMASERAPYIDQSQSFNHYINVPTKELLNSIHLCGWKAGLKTGSYYIRVKPATDPKKFSVDFASLNAHSTHGGQSTQNVHGGQSTQNAQSAQNAQSNVCSRDNPNCSSCSA